MGIALLVDKTIRVHSTNDSIRMPNALVFIRA